MSCANISTVPTAEVKVRVPATNKRFGIMKFHASANLPSDWSKAEMTREDNGPKRLKKHQFGARKYATRQKEYKSENQPWILTPDVTSAKKFRGVKEGGIGDNSDFWIFVRAPDGAFDAYPVAEWYSFKNMPTYKPLTAEEAEAAFAKSAKSYDISRGKKAEKRNAEDEEEVRSTKFDYIDQSLSNDEDEEDGAIKSKKKSNFEFGEKREEEFEDDRNVEFIDSDPESDDESIKSVEEMSDSESEEEEKMSSDSDSGDFDDEPSTGLKRKREFDENASDEHFSPPPKKFKPVAPLVDPTLKKRKK